MTLKKIFTSDGIWTANGLALIRIVTGLLMAYHGREVFDRVAMEEYMKWDVIQVLPFPEVMVYIGKGGELFSGGLLALGLFTRAATILMSMDMLFICFKIGHGKFYYDDQHPFLFAMIAFIFFFNGAGKWSLDKKLK